MNTLDDLPVGGDGMLDLNEIMRSLLETLLNTVMEEQAAELCEQSGTSRNGYRERGLLTCVGEVTLRIPKLREGTYFPDDVIERWSRTDTAMASAICEMWVSGVSTRKVDEITSKLGVRSMSRSRVSRLCKALDEEVAILREGDLSDRAWPYLWLDATYVSCRAAGAARAAAVVIAVAADERARRRVVGIECIDTESYIAWRDFLIRLRSRGLSGVQLVTSDEHAGLVRAGYERACDLMREHDASSAELMGSAAEEALAYLAFPHEHARWIRTNNVCERMNREIKRRTDAIQVFPSAESLLRLVGALCCDQNDSWLQEKNFINARSMVGLAPVQPDFDFGDEEIARVRSSVKEVFEKRMKAA